jgi:hypothetical protein
MRHGANMNAIASAPRKTKKPRFHRRSRADNVAQVVVNVAGGERDGPGHVVVVAVVPADRGGGEDLVVAGGGGQPGIDGGMKESLHHVEGGKPGRVGVFGDPSLPQRGNVGLQVRRVGRGVIVSSMLAGQKVVPLNAPCLPGGWRSPGRAAG